MWRCDYIVTVTYGGLDCIRNEAGVNYSPAQPGVAPGKAIFINYPPIRAAWQARSDANVGNLNFHRQFVNMFRPLFRSRGHGPAARSAGGPSRVSLPGPAVTLVRGSGAGSARGCLRRAGKAANARRAAAAPCGGRAWREALPRPCGLVTPGPAGKGSEALLPPSWRPAHPVS